MLRTRLRPSTCRYVDVRTTRRFRRARPSFLLKGANVRPSPRRGQFSRTDPVLRSLSSHCGSSPSQPRIAHLTASTGWAPSRLCDISLLLDFRPSPWGCLHAHSRFPSGRATREDRRSASAPPTGRLTAVHDDLRLSRRAEHSRTLPIVESESHVCPSSAPFVPATATLWSRFDCCTLECPVQRCEQPTLTNWRNYAPTITNRRCTRKRRCANYI